jgi:cholesterol transport system auxiliary component
MMIKPLFQPLQRTVVHTASVLTVCLLAACATPQAPVAKAVYDLGLPWAAPAGTAPALGAVPTSAVVAAASSGATTSGAPTLAAPSAAPPAVVLADIATGAALDSTAMLYRLSYADVYQLRPYTLARWSMPPAQLLRQRLRDALSARGPVLSPSEGSAAWRVVVELDEFSQVFDTPTTSAAVVQLRATLLRGDQSVAQHTINARASTPSADAAGGARAMATAADDAARQLAAWTALQMAKP